MKTVIVRILTAALLAFVLSFPARADVILDDDFNGTTLNSAVWQPTYDSTGTASVYGGRLHLNPGAVIELTNSYGLNYVNIAIYGVDNSGWGCGLIGAMGGAIGFGVFADHDTILQLDWSPDPPPNPVHLGRGSEKIDLGQSSDGDYEIIWTPVLFQVINNGNILYSQDDPSRIPYYYAMGPFSLGAGGTVSVDRVVITTPEPTTLFMLALGVLVQGGALIRRRK